MLNTYLTRATRLLHDPNYKFWTQSDITDFINEARAWVAAEGQCIKVLPPGTNAVASIAVTAGGSGYLSAPTVVITGNGTGATATATLVGNAVSTIAVVTGGSAYDKNTTISFTGGGGGTGAKATATVNCLNTVANQEIYTFLSANALAQLTSGVGSILFVESIAVSWGALKPVLQQWEWNDLQARVRAYPLVSGQPAMWAQLGQGEGGSVYIQPEPTSALPMEWNCVCMPVDLVDDTTPEAIPAPWTLAVPYYAAYLAFLGARRPIEAQNMYQIYENYIKRSRTVSESSYVPDYYA